MLFGCNSIEERQLIESTPTAENILITNVDVFDGEDSVLTANQYLLLEGGIIKSITTNLPDTVGLSAHTINGFGKTIIPGLIDAHVHLSGSGAVPWDNYRANESYNLQAYLHTGITTVYDLGGLSKGLEELTEKVKEQTLVGPDIFHTHIPITVKNSHPIPLTEIMLPWPLKTMVNTISPTIEAVDEADDLIADYLENEVDFVKLICDQIPPGSPQMTYEQMKALISAAHKNKKKVFVHIGSPENAVNAIKAGADVLAHGVWRGQLTKEQAEFIARSKVPLIYTLSGFENITHIHHGDYTPTRLDSIVVPHEILSPVLGENGKHVHNQEVMNAFFESAAENKKYWKQNFRLLLEAGAVIAVGTDSNLPGTYAGSTYLQELELLKEYGLSNFEILKAATTTNANLFLKSPDFGSVKVGHKANLILLDRNPIEDLTTLESPSLIIKNGKLISRISY